MLAWLPSCVALGAVIVALAVGPADDGALLPLTVTAAQHDAAEAAAPAPDGLVRGLAVAAPVTFAATQQAATAAASAPSGDDPGAVAEPPAAPTQGATVLPVGLDVWPIAVTAGQLDAVAARGERLYLATQTLSERPLIDPAMVRVHALDASGAAAAAPWEAAILGPSPLALAASGQQVLGVWNHRAHPGRDLAIVRLGDTPASGRPEVLAAPADGGPFTPVGQPLVAPAADGGWLVCSNSAGGPPRCVALDRDATPRWDQLAGLTRYPLWRLVPVGDGFYLFGTDCDHGDWGHDGAASAISCRTPRVLVQELDGAGHPRGRLRWIARLQGSRELGVVPTGDGVMLFGRRAAAKESIGLMVRHRGGAELDGRWNRTAGGVPDEDGALLVEVDKLHMEDGVPVAGFRPRRCSAAAGRLAPDTWPEAVAALQPRALDQRAVTGGEVMALFDPAAGGVIRGVAVRPRPPAAGLAHAGTATAP